MHFLKATLAFIAIVIATACMCTALTWWATKLLWLKGSARSQNLQKMDKVIIGWTKANRWTFKKLNLVNVNITWHDQEQVFSGKLVLGSLQPPNLDRHLVTPNLSLR